MPISLTCKCGKRLAVPDNAAGKRARCPGCGVVIAIHRPVSQADTHALPPSEFEPNLDALVDEAIHEQTINRDAYDETESRPSKRSPQPHRKSKRGFLNSIYWPKVLWGFIALLLSGVPWGMFFTLGFAMDRKSPLDPSEAISAMLFFSTVIATYYAVLGVPVMMISKVFWHSGGFFGFIAFCLVWLYVLGLTGCVPGFAALGALDWIWQGIAGQRDKSWNLFTWREW